MARNTNKKLVDSALDLFRKANSSERQKWQYTAQKSQEFFLGDQLTDDEQRTLLESGMPDFIVNRITPVIEMMKFFATANNPRWQAVGAEGSDSDVAAVHADIADYCWYNSNGNSLYAHVIQDALVKGVGFLQVDVDPDQDRGMGEVIFNRIDPFDVYVDPMARDFLFRDANYIIVKKDLPKSQLMNLFPDKKNKIKKSNSSQTGINDYSERDRGNSDATFHTDLGQVAYKVTGEEDEIIDYYEVYSKEKILFYNMFISIPPPAGEMAKIEEDVKFQLKDAEAEMMVTLVEKKKELSELVAKGEMVQERAMLEMERIEKQARDEFEKQKEILINKQKEAKTQIKNYILNEVEYNVFMGNPQTAKTVIESIKFYETRIKLVVVCGDVLLFKNIIPVTEYPIVPFVYQFTGTPFPLGAVTPMVGKQRELNKAHQILIHNANLASNLRWLYEEGSVPEDEWEQYSASPGALLKYRSGFAPPVPVQPMPLNQAFFGITTTAREDMEYISGVYSSMQGDTSSNPETYRGLLAMDEYGTRRIKAWMQNTIEPALEHLGRIFKDYSQEIYQANKVFRIVQPNNIDEEKVIEINIPIFDDLGNASQKFNDYGTAKFDVRIIGGSTLPLNRWALLEEYFKWYQAGLIDDIAMIGETDIRNKEAVIQRKSIYMQLRTRLEEMESVITDREGTIETLERQLVQSNIKSKSQDANMRMEKDMLESEAAQSSLRDKLRNEAAFKLKELDLAFKKSSDTKK